MQDVLSMTTDEKKAFLVLKSVLFHHQGLEAEESDALKQTAHELNAVAELEWTREFILQDKITAYDRARQYVNTLATAWSPDAKLAYLAKVWDSTNRKGYISEMEATAILRLAKDWQLQKELIQLVRQKKNPQ